jgi:rod shape determining protein RodA
MLRSGFWRHFDFWLMGAVTLAMVFGVAMVRSAIGCNQSLANLVTRQVVFVGLGIPVILIVAAIDFRFWGGVIRPMYAVIVIFLIVLRLTAGQRFGATRWIETGLVSIQPTELAKIVIILTLAYYFFRTREAEHSWVWMAQSLMLALGIAVLIFIQPNLSNVIVILVIWAAMAWISGLQLKQLGIMVFGALTVAVVAFPFIASYQQQRVLNFFFPPANASQGATYNVIQALIALGAGGLAGEGYGHGTQTQLCFMKVRQTDFIFSVIGEEFGFIGALLVVLLLGFIIYRCLRAARVSGDPFGSLIAYGVAILIFFQSAVNIAVTLKLMPVTGLPLPFISYGGSGLLSLMIGVGLVESVVLRHKPLDF